MFDVRAIGVFDSGLGGLTILRELRSRFPNEDFVYLGDVARLPYGTKSAAVVTQYALSCAGFLVGHEVKAIVVACNTATAVALPTLRQEFSIPVVGVIESGVSAALERTHSHACLVCATESTVQSEAYVREFQRQSPRTRVYQKAMGLLVPLVECGWNEHPVTETIISTYLAECRGFEFDTVVLGCTHYPLLAPLFSKLLRGVSIVDSSHGVGKALDRILIEAGLKNSPTHLGEARAFSTDRVAASPMVKSLFGCPQEFSVIDLP